jgi:hypothetical protein
LLTKAHISLKARSTGSTNKSDKPPMMSIDDGGGDTDVEMEDVELNCPMPVKAKARYQNLPPRSPNPTRASRVVHPGAPDMKRSKRTSSEIKAIEEHKRENRLRLQMLEQEKINV